MGVRDYLTQVVLNLVLNAIDATDDQGRIHVAARVEDGWLVLSVEDDGRGISIADRCRLFQPFFTTKSPRHRPGAVCEPADPRRFCRHAFASARSPARGPRSSFGFPWIAPVERIGGGRACRSASIAGPTRRRSSRPGRCCRRATPRRRWPRRRASEIEHSMKSIAPEKWNDDAKAREPRRRRGAAS